MTGDAQGGTNMAKMIVGIILMAAGNLMMIKLYPTLPTPLTSPHAAPMGPGTLSPELSGLKDLLPDYFKVMMSSLLLINVGAIFVYLSRESKQA